MIMMIMNAAYLLSSIGDHSGEKVNNYHHTVKVQPTAHQTIYFGLFTALISNILTLILNCNCSI
jgi:hypothetical protein